MVFLPLDIGDQNSIQCFAQMLHAQYGGLDILVNNAAIAFKVHKALPLTKPLRSCLTGNPKDERLSVLAPSTYEPWILWYHCANAVFLFKCCSHCSCLFRNLPTDLERLSSTHP